MADRDWQSLALELVEASSDAPSRDSMFQRVFQILRSRFGFEHGSVLAFDSDAVVIWNKSRSYERVWLEARQRYSRELMPMLEAAARSRHVVADRDVLALAERERLSFYAEYVRPLRVKSYAAVLLGRGAAQSQAISFSRERAAGFQLQELELLRRLRPTLSLLSRLFPTAPGPGTCRPRASAALTPREAEIAHYVARGLRNSEIALLCGCSPFTVRNQLVSIFRKLDVSTRAELAMYLHGAR